MSIKKLSWLSKFIGIKRYRHGNSKVLAKALPKAAEGVWAREAEVPLEWNKGDVILSLYEVKYVHHTGGMGFVYRVYHKNWNIDLAVKSPRPEYFQTDSQKENFIHECETWIDLGLHPHIVTCHYVRTLGGIPRVFAEYIEGGSLYDWVENRKLYKGDRRKVLGRMLDIVIQSAWGLHYAHEQGVLHQDIKPANILLTQEGVAKVTDFGLAKARAATAEQTVRHTEQSILASYGGCTPAYCSPEQAYIASMRKANMDEKMLPKLTRRSDIWNWGVSILEMFTGKVFWRNGEAARETLQYYLEMDAGEKYIPKMPKELSELLIKCFQQNPNDRPHDMLEILIILLDVYKAATGNEYLRKDPQAIDLTVDNLNNQAISLLDLGRSKEAVDLFDRALQINSKHLEVTYNRGLTLWRLAQSDNSNIVRQLETIRKDQTENWKVDYLLGLVHLENGQAERAIKFLEKALLSAGDPTPVEKALQIAKNGSKNAIVQVFPDTDKSPVAYKCKTEECWQECVMTLYDHTANCIALGKQQNFILLGLDQNMEIRDLVNDEVSDTSGHRGTVNSIAISPDGQYGVSGSEDRTLRLWDLKTKKWIRTFKGHKGAVNSVAISLNGKYLLSGSSDLTLKLWDSKTGKCIITFSGHHAAVNSVAISSDGNYGLSGSVDKSVRLWYLKERRCLRTFRVHKGAVNSVAIGSWYGISGSSDATLKLWNIMDLKGGCLHTLNGHEAKINSVAITSDRRYGLSGSDDCTIKLWDLVTGKCLRTYYDTDPITSVAISSKKTYAISVGKYIKVWDVFNDLCGIWAGYAPSRISMAIEGIGRI